MKFSPLGRTGVAVSRIALGTMTFGEQNTEAEGHAQLDAAFAAGVNFIDTAEMYSFPARAETYGRSEEIVGTWLKARGGRDDAIIATKIVGPAGRFPYIRDGNPRHTRRHIETAVEDSLRRLRTDRIDLYQLHWPERNANYFGRLGYRHDEEESGFEAPEDILAVMNDLVKAGKVRWFGVSNETPWGVMKYLAEADARGLPRVASVQNPYSLLNRTYEVGLAEVSAREDCGLLVYSPLGFGALTGKYLDGKKPAGARYTLFPGYARNFQPRGIAATRAYVDLARMHGLDPAQMAIAYVVSRPFVTSAIIGATTVEQLATDIAAISLTLPDEVMEGIEAIHAADPNPAP